MSFTARLRQFFRAWWPLPTGGGSSPPAPPPPDAGAVISSINYWRLKAGLKALADNPALTGAAQNHALYMRSAGVLTHAGLTQRMRAAGWAGGRIGEVIARGQQTVPEVVADWMNDPPHRAELLRPDYTDAGAGRAGDFWCVDFGG